MADRPVFDVKGGLLFCFTLHGPPLSRKADVLALSTSKTSSTSSFFMPRQPFVYAASGVRLVRNVGGFVHNVGGFVRNVGGF